MARKRGQNEGTIFQRKDGLWCVQVSLEGKRVTRYFHTQAECRTWLRKTHEQIRNGLSLSAANSTVGTFMDEWLASVRTAVREKTFRQYGQILRMHILPVLGKAKLKDLRPDQIQQLYNRKLQSGCGPRTVKLIHAVLHRGLNQALRWGLIGRNPASAVTPPKVKRREMQTLTDSQVRVLLSAAAGNRFEALYWLAVTTGMREGELLGLKWADLDWVNRRIRVQRQLQYLPSGLAFTEPKSAAGRRVIALGEGIVARLRTHLARQEDMRRTAGDAWEDNDLLFPARNGRPMQPRNLYSEFKALLKKAELPDIRFHDLRHTAATLMLQLGVHPKIVSERLGHSDVSMTLNVYSHVLPDMQDEAAETLDEMLTPIEVSDQIKKIGDKKPAHVPARRRSAGNGG